MPKTDLDGIKMGQELVSSLESTKAISGFWANNAGIIVGFLLLAFGIGIIAFLWFYFLHFFKKH